MNSQLFINIYIYSVLLKTKKYINIFINNNMTEIIKTNKVEYKPKRYFISPLNTFTGNNIVL